MSEKFRSSFERDPSSEEMDKLNSIVKKYLSEQSGHPTEEVEKDIDEVLSRYIEKGQELSPAVRASLRKTIKRMLGDKIER